MPPIGLYQGLHSGSGKVDATSLDALAAVLLGLSPHDRARLAALLLSQAEGNAS